MDDDPLTNTLMTEYEATADMLQKGVNVGTETLNKYHGMTGKLLAATMRNLWSQQELEEQIDKRVQKKCETCARASASSVGWLDVAKQKAGLIIICVTIILSMAILCNRVNELRSLWVDVENRVTQTK